MQTTIPKPRPLPRLDLAGLTNEQLERLKLTINNRIAKNDAEARRARRRPAEEKIPIDGSGISKAIRAHLGPGWHGPNDVRGKVYWCISYQKAAQILQGTRQWLTWDELALVARGLGRSPQEFMLFN